MANEIFVIKTMGDALRNTGYKNIESAMAEIIDNSLQANAKDVFVIVSEECNEQTGHYNISEIAFLDNGDGMNIEELGACLGIGYSTRTDRKGMGRFGVGLPQASLYACPNVEVYSWQNGYPNCKKVYLDINQIKEGVQTAIEDPVSMKLPDKYENYLNYKVLNPRKSYDFCEHGTLVLWKNCDRVVPKTVTFLFKKLDFELGKKFRYFIHDSQCDIRLVDNENPDSTHSILPNDPLMLMIPNYVLGNKNNPKIISPGKNEGCTESVFELYRSDANRTGIVTKMINYFDINENVVKQAPVTITFSKVKDIFYDKTAIAGNPGQTSLGQHVKQLEGISIVRANREIDFGQFDFYENIDKPEHRWWGCEIKFDPVLDEAFGVANNKQHVELRKVEEDDYEGEEVKPVWAQIESVVKNTIKAMYMANKETRQQARTSKDIETPTTKIINEVEKDEEAKGESDYIKSSTSEEELKLKNKGELISQGVVSPTDIVNNSWHIYHKDISTYAALSKAS